VGQKEAGDRGSSREGAIKKAHAGSNVPDKKKPSERRGIKKVEGVPQRKMEKTKNNKNRGGGTPGREGGDEQLLNKKGKQDQEKRRARH